MIIYASCPRCSTRNRIKTNATNRSELEREKGEIIKVQCSKCQNKREYHVNECRADLSITIMIWGLIAGLVFGLLLWKYLYAIALASFLVPIYVWQQQQKSTRSFNNYKVKELERPSN